MKGSFHKWPVDVDPRGEVPSEEVKVVNIADAMPSLAEKLQRVLSNASTLSSLIGTMARLIAAAKGGKEAITRNVSAEQRRQAWKLLVWGEQMDIRTQHKNNQFESLGAYIEGGLVVCRGRFSEEKLMAMLGIPALPILSCTSKLSRLIMRQAHQEDHRRSPFSVLAASRR